MAARRLFIPLILGVGLTLAAQFFASDTAKVNATVRLANEPPMVGQATLLYDGALDTGTPDTQGFLYLTSLFASATQSFAGGVATLDTTPDRDDQAGYFGNVPLLLDRSAGYTLRFTAQVISETHVSDHRAGFSVILLSSDLRGIELGFWQDEIWAQEGGTAPDLFTHAEGKAFDTTSGLVPYELTVLGDVYALTMTDTLILSGTLRDYTAFDGFPDPYETPNLVFMGDDTSSASAEVRLSYVSVLNNTALEDRTVATGEALPLNDLGVMDIDAGGQTVNVTLTVHSGVLTATTTAPHGLTSGEIGGNGTATVVMTGTVGEINATLAATPGLVYRSRAGFVGTDTLTVTVNDDGHTGSGGPLTSDKRRSIDVTDVPDVTSPEIVTTAPISGAGDVSITAPVIITFSEAISSGTFVYAVTPDPSGWGESWRDGGTVITLNHHPFAYQTAYTVAVTAAADLAGNPLTGAPVAWSFTTTHAADATPPQVVATFPPDGAPEVALDAAVAITFSEAIDANTLTYTVAPDPGGWSATWNSGSAMIPAGSAVTLTHHPFAYQTTYIFSITAAADLAGNPLAGAPVTWSFTTLSTTDAVSPTVVSVRPPDGAQEVAVDAAVTITFSEPINAGTLVYDVTPDPGGWEGAWSQGATVVTLGHAPFAYRTAYTVTVTTAEDLAGNSLAGTPYLWRFTTVPYRLYLPLAQK